MPLAPVAGIGQVPPVAARQGELAHCGQIVDGERVMKQSTRGRPLRPSLLGSGERSNPVNDWPRSVVGG